MDHIEMGTTPCDEPCAAVGRIGYTEQCREEIARFRKGLKRFFGEPPEGFALRRYAESHSEGLRFELVVQFDASSPASVDYAFTLEREVPTTWRELESGPVYIWTPDHVYQRRHTCPNCLNDVAWRLSEDRRVIYLTCAAVACRADARLSPGGKVEVSTGVPVANP